MQPKSEQSIQIEKIARVLIPAIKPDDVERIYKTLMDAASLRHYAQSNDADTQKRLLVTAFLVGTEYGYQHIINRVAHGTPPHMENVNGTNNTDQTNMPTV